MNTSRSHNLHHHHNGSYAPTLSMPLQHTHHHTNTHSSTLFPPTNTSHTMLNNDDYKEQHNNHNNNNNAFHLHQSATNRSSASVDCKVSHSQNQITNSINQKIVRFSSQMNTIDQYTPYSNNVQQRQPLNLSNSNSKSSMTSIPSIPRATPSNSQSTDKKWNKLQLNSTNTQSSTSFKNDLLSPQSSNYSHSKSQSHTLKLRSSQIAQCPNMVHSKCRCKDILSQNSAAQNMWNGCYRILVLNKNQSIDNREIEIAYFDGLYPKLINWFEYKLGTNRAPTKEDISAVIMKFGAFLTDDGELMIDRCSFLSFYQWFRGSVDIILDIFNLWDTKFPFQTHPFMNRAKCQKILESAPQGTFVLRLSHSQKNGMVLSYSEPTFNRKIRIRHILLVRQSEQNYLTKTNHSTQKSSDLNKLIRTFVKLQFFYTPTMIYKKNRVF